MAIRTYDKIYVGGAWVPSSGSELIDVIDSGPNTQLRFEAWNGGALGVTAATAESESDYDKALRCYEELDPPPLVDLARCLEGLGRWAEAVEGSHGRPPDWRDLDLQFATAGGGVGAAGLLSGTIVGARGREAFTAEGYQARQLQVYYSAVGDPEVPDDAADRLHGSLPPAVAAVLRQPRHSVATLPGIPQTVPRTYIGATAYLSVVGLPEDEGLVETVRGRLPRPGSPLQPLPRDAAAEYDGPDRVHLVEVALHERAANLLGIAVGSIVDVNPVRYGGPGGPIPTLLRVVGTYRPASPERSALDE